MRRDYCIQECRVAPAGEDKATIVVYVNPDENEKRYLTQRLQIDEHTLQSALDPDELARLEFEPEHAAIIFKRPKNYSAKDQFLFRILSTGVFVFKNQLIVVQGDDLPLFDGKEFQRINTLADVLLRLLYRAIIHFREHLRVINMISDELQTKIIKSMENTILLNMFSIEKSLEYYVNSITSNGILLEKLKIYAGRLGFSGDELEMLDDVIVENNQCSKQAEIYSNILASLMDARASIVSNNLNILMKTLNIITIGIMVPTFVVSAFSMNVKIPLSDHPYAFWLVMGLAVISVVGFFAVMRHRKW